MPGVDHQRIDDVLGVDGGQPRRFVRSRVAVDHACQVDSALLYGNFDMSARQGLLQRLAQTANIRIRQHRIHLRLAIGSPENQAAAARSLGSENDLERARGHCIQYSWITHIHAAQLAGRIQKERSTDNQMHRRIRRLLLHRARTRDGRRFQRHRRQMLLRARERCW